jgi:hypothetical protein
MYKGIIQEALAIRSNVEHHRHDPIRVHASGRGADRKLTYSYRDTANSPVAQASDVFRIGREQDVNISERCLKVPERLIDSLRVIDGQVEAAAKPTLLALMLHRLPDGEIIDDRNHVP